MNKTIEEHHQMLEATKELSHKQGFITIFLIFGIFIVWSIFAQIETTITASGKTITQADIKSVKNTVGGVVRDIFVKEGDEVKKGQSLLKLDSVNEQTKLNSNIKQFDANLVTICRLRSQSTLSKELNCSSIENKILLKNEYKNLIHNADILFNSNIKMLNTSIELLTTQMKTLTNQADVDIYKYRIELRRGEFINSSLVTLDKLLLKNRLIYDNIVSLNSRVKNLLVTAPSGGIVTNMQIKGTGEIVNPFRQILSIVPTSKEFLIEAYVSPTDIEKIHKGQIAEVSFPSFIDPSALPITGEITYISADVIESRSLPMPSYRVVIEITKSGKEAIAKNNFNIIAGMPSAVFIHTGKTTLASYLLNPIALMFKGIFNAN